MNKKIAVIIVSVALLTSIMCVGNLRSVKAQNVTVVSSTGFLDYGIYRIVGEVQNTGSGWAAAEIAATLTNASGTIGMIYGVTMVGTIPPGGKSPFEAVETVSEAASQVTSYTLQVTPSVTSSVPMSLEITSNAHSINSAGIYHITGQVLNTGSSNATAPQVVATFYDSSGKVVDDALAYPTQSGGIIAAGTSASFTISPQDSTRQSLYASYTLVAESNEYISQPVSSSSSTSSTATPTSSASVTATPVIPEFPPIAIASLVVAMLLIAAVMMTVKKRSISIS